MMEKRFKLTVQEVLDKQFNIDFKGYSSHEVDEFLDLVISDYQEYEQANMALKAKIVELEGKNGNIEEQTQGNLDILKRLTRLENEVFRK